MICGNADKYNQIRSWLQQRLQCQDRYLSFDSLLFVSGRSGIGKTHNIKLICEELQLHVAYITSSQCSSSAELQDVIIKNITSSMLQLLTNDTKQKVIVIDELETMMALDRMINTTLYNILSNGRMKNIPIICISSGSNMKKMGTIKKRCVIVELDEPTDDDICELLQTLYPFKDTESIKQVVNSTSNNIEQCIQKAGSNPSACNMDESVSAIALYGPFDRELMRRTITDVLLVPLNYHENLLIELRKRHCNIKRRQAIYRELIKNYIRYDMMVSKSNSNIPTDLFISMIYPMTLLPLKKGTSSTMDNFTKILSYQSLQKKNVKKFYSSVFPLYQINNYHINMIGRKYMFFN